MLLPHIVASAAMSLTLTHSHPYHPRMCGCAARCAMVEEPNGELGPITRGTRVGIPTHNEGEGPLAINVQ